MVRLEFAYRRPDGGLSMVVTQRGMEGHAVAVAPDAFSALERLKKWTLDGQPLFTINKGGMDWTCQSPEKTSNEQTS